MGNELTTAAAALEPRGDLPAQILARFIDFLDVSPQTVKTYSNGIRQFFRFMELYQIDRPRREDVIAYREELRAVCKPATVQAYITALRLFFRWTATAGIYPNIAEHIKGAKISKDHKKDYFTPAQVKAILQSIDRETTRGKRDFAIISLMVTTGLRDIELHRADVGDLRARGGSTVLYICGKGRAEKADFVKVVPEVEAAIRDYLRSRGRPGAGQPLFASASNNSTGRRLSVRSISGTAKRCFISAGYDSDRLTAHSLRHTAVTLALLGGASLQEAQQFARHSNIGTTQIYAHNLDKERNQCAEIIGKTVF